MKKLLLLLLTLVVAMVITGCSKSNSPEESDAGTDQTQTIVSEDNAENQSETSLDEKPQIESEAKPESKPEPEPEPVTKPETKPDTLPDTKPETKPEDNILKGELKDIIGKIYSIAGVKLPQTTFTELTPENSEYFIGTNNIEYVEALASEPSIGSYPHSLVLIRVKDGTDINKAKAEIKNKVNPRKWICVGVEPEKVVIDNIDNLIILVMDNESDKFHNAFLSLAK
ncbi:hypothetical protein [Desulfitobacterium sp.]|uniref:hypothetical protein n=1 Tax=Desulfitobacterium sp. TaxID=49981 RepID=UPI002B20FB66|nr:hypothetical protein [Desulfitobacterium sp.]MEA4902541.1 hypothetical protein [Desulfitobacterium sp.]